MANVSLTVWTFSGIVGTVFLAPGPATPGDEHSRNANTLNRRSHGTTRKLPEASVTAAKTSNQMTPKQNVTHGNSPAKRVLDDKSLIDDAADFIKPAPPPANSEGEFKNTGPVWWIGLNNDQTHALETVMATTGNALATLAGPLWPEVAAALNGSLLYRIREQARRK